MINQGKWKGTLPRLALNYGAKCDSQNGFRRMCNGHYDDESVGAAVFDAFNRCDRPGQLDRHAAYFDPSVEFYHDTGGVTWTRMHTMDGCLSIGLGKAKDGADYYTLYMWGAANGGTRGCSSRRPAIVRRAASATPAMAATPASLAGSSAASRRLT